MRSACLLFILVIAVYDVSAEERCPPENCFADSSKCEIPMLNVECENSLDTCCSVVKSDFRTKCRHHGGECMESCAATLQRHVDNCDPTQVCCVLV